MNDLQTILMLDLKTQYHSIRGEIQAAIQQVLESQYFILGPEVEALEEEVAKYSGCQFGIGVSSGTDALLVSLMAIGLQPGDEVITTPYSFFATAGSAVRLGAVPVFVDIDRGTYNIQADHIAQAVTSRTKAILPVHLTGQMADMGPVMEVARKYGLHVIEDACQAIGADYRGQRAGSMGRLGCFSFFPSKNLGGYGDSGMVTTNDPALADRVRLLRNHGHQPKYYNKLVGGNFRMDALQAAVLRVKFKYLESWTEARRRNAQTYRRLFTDAGLCDRVTLPLESGFGRHIFHLFMICVEQRDALQKYLHNRKIATEVYYPVPLHLQECFAYMGYPEGTYPASEYAARHSLALPIYPELTESMQERIVASIADFYVG